MGLEPVAVREGDTVTLTVDITDPGLLDLHSLEVNWRDRTDSTYSSTIPSFSSHNHTYSNDNADDVYTIAVTVDDHNGGLATECIDITVENAAPVCDPIAGFPTTPVLVGNPLVGSLAFRDPGILDTHTAVWDWGNGDSTVGLIAESNGAGIATGGTPMRPLESIPLSVLYRRGMAALISR